VNCFKYLLKKTFFLFILISSISYLQAQQAKYVFYFIGDGMGPAHVALTEAYLAATEDEIGFQKLSFTDFPATGYATTYAENRLITGSAAAGTALACGQKTTISTIGMNGDRTQPLKSIAEEARDNGFKVGIITSVSLDHATPASFYAHQPSRSMYYEISMELPKSTFDFFGGGGFADPYKDNSLTTSVYELAPQFDYTITSTIEGFENLEPGAGKVIATGTRLGSSGALPYFIDQNEDDIPLEDFVEKAIEFLYNENGFFIMCEEGKIDWASHGNDGASVIQNVISLSISVEKALDFYHQHPDETLIVVTADHETGGLSLGSREMAYDSDLKLLAAQKISAEKFSELADSLLNKNPNEEPGFEYAMTLVEKYFGVGGSSGITLSNTELNRFEQAYNNSILIANEYGGYHPMAQTAIEVLNSRAGIGWNSYSHTALPVPVYAIGAGQEIFNGYYDNTDIPKKIAEIMGLGEWIEGDGN
jgi:alkaline phosphatase